MTNIDALSGILRGAAPPTADPGAATRRAQESMPLGPGEAQPGGDFATTLRRAVQGVNAVQQTADAKAMAMVQGEDVPIHEVMIAVTEAEMSVQLTTAVASKAIQAYQEIWRMDV